MSNNDHIANTLKLAQKARGHTLNNPMVGCLIVKGGKMIARGYHKKWGADHAEVNALKKLKKEEAKGATLFVNLEPCCNRGKTPPCTKAIVKAGIKKVVIGMKDPNPTVNGRGIRELRKAGIEVKVGILQKKCETLNKKYLKFISTGMPYVLVKSAITLDGAVTDAKNTRTPLSSPESVERVHQLRHEYDAVGVGSNTVIVDNPRLTCRIKNGINPIRVIFDSRLKIPTNAGVFKEPGETIVLTCYNINTSEKRHFLKKNPLITIVEVPKKGQHLNLKKALKILGKQGIGSILIEGGPTLTTALLNAKLVNELMLIHTPKVSKYPDYSPKFFTKKLKPFLFKNPKWEIVGKDAWLTVDCVKN
jgi:diaminohydroxyphosphoribosylaminopyrimidine deaminase / 5-amino-6-(5-phosphoribosylamino)uracil reductase